VNELKPTAARTFWFVAALSAMSIITAMTLTGFPFRAPGLDGNVAHCSAVRWVPLSVLSAIAAPSWFALTATGRRTPTPRLHRAC
jgi:hypothetical protein